MVFLLEKKFLVLLETPGGNLYVLLIPSLAVATNFGRGIKYISKITIKRNGLI